MNFKEFKNKYCKETPIHSLLSPKIEGWGSESIALTQAIKETNPKSIVEVGTYLGASAIHLAKHTKSEIICVDTFLASNEILWREGNVNNLVENFTQIYYQFCANITYKGLNSQISPLPMTSSAAAELFKEENVKIDMVYIDAGHREREVYADLEDWWPLTNLILVGDDYSSRWPGVVSAVDRFCLENNLKMQIIDYKFILRR
jgi:cephalosporin hydroxylase